MSEEIKLVPVQLGPRKRQNGTVRESVYLRAFEVYAHLYGSQDSAEKLSLHRGGFDTTEIVMFLYARAFPKEQWRQRVDEALVGLNV